MWSLFDSRTGKRVTLGAWSSEESARRTLDEIRYRNREDLRDLIPHIEVGELLAPGYDGL